MHREFERISSTWLGVAARGLEVYKLLTCLRNLRPTQEVERGTKGPTNASIVVPDRVGQTLIFSCKVAIICLSMYGHVQ